MVIYLNRVNDTFLMIVQSLPQSGIYNSRNNLFHQPVMSIPEGSKSKIL